MTWSRFKKATRVFNRVNLGNLYSLSQNKAYLLGSMPSISPYRYSGFPSHGVNLGDLYKGAHKNDSWRQPMGWAYFEDGSIFVARSSYDHDDFQRAMNIFAPFVRNPSDANRAPKSKDRHQRQLILIEKPIPLYGFDPAQFHAYARYADNREKFFAPSMPFGPLFLTLDRTQTFPISITWANQRMDDMASMFHQWDVKQLLKSLRTFRGTLYDGILQPNVRPSNGIKLSIGLPPKRSSLAAPVVQKKATLKEKQSQIHQPDATPQQTKPELQSSREKVEGPHVVRARSESKRWHERKPEQSPDPIITNSDAKALQLEAWARELKQREELLGWKHKAWKLEHKLALAKNRLQEESHKTYARQPSAAVSLRKKSSTSARQVEHSTDTKPRKPRDNLSTQDMAELRKESKETPELKDKWDIAAANAAKAKEAAKRAAQAQKDTKNPAEIRADVDLMPEFLSKDETLPINALEWLRKRKRG